MIADGTVLAAADLRLDESILTGESEPARRAVGDEVRSGAFVVEGTGAYRVTAVGEDSFAARDHRRGALVPPSALAAGAGRQPAALRAGRAGGRARRRARLLALSPARDGRTPPSRPATAGVVTLIPEGLMVLVSLTYAAAAVRMSRRGVLAQQLNAIESLASVDTICVDKTGTLTEATLRVVELVPGRRGRRGHGQRGAGDARGERLGAQPDAAGDRRRLSRPSPSRCSARCRSRAGAAGARSRSRQGASTSARPDAIPVGELGTVAEQRQREGRRVLALAAARIALPADAGELPPEGLRPLGLVVLAEELRPNVRETVAFLLEQGIEIKVLSGDSPQTVAAIARDVGIPVAVSSRGGDPRRRGRAAAIRRRRDGRRPHLPGGQAGDRRRRSGTRAATWRWSVTASTTCRR